MFKKVLFISSVLLCVLFSQISVECFADATAQLEQATTYIEENQFEQAKAYVENKHYEQAEVIYQTIAQDYPDTNDALAAQTGLTVLYITWAKEPEAQAGLAGLVADFSGYQGIANSLNEIADTFRHVQRYQKAGELYQYVIDGQPPVKDAIWSQACLIGLDVVLGDDDTAQSALEQLLSEFSDVEDMPAIFDGLAEDCVEVKKYNEARQLYQYILDNMPDSERAIWVQSGLGISNAGLGNDAAAQAAIETLLTEFSGHPSLGELILAIAEPYYDEAFRKQSEGLESQASSYFQTAITIAELVKSEVPDFVIEPDTYLWEGACYRELGEYEKSIECYQKVVDDYPDHSLAWHALFLVGRNYEDLKESGVLSKSEADARIKAAYEQLLRDYPDCKAARYARRWLSSHNST
jgi:tetratricopeptide (TPR) repeat protein